MTEPNEIPDTSTLVPIVVGAHLRAEIEDRPLGARVRRAVKGWLRNQGPGIECAPLVCTDLWYLNAPDLVGRPTIAVGDPAVNAASAWFANRLPTVLVVEGSLQIQLDPELIHLQACVWGVDREATGSAVELFIERYLDPFLRAACGVGQT